MLAELISILLSATTPSGQIPPPASAQTPDGNQTVRLEDVEVTGRRLDSLISTFVREVAAPNYGRNFARWDRSICVGAVNLRHEAAQYVVDRVSTIAEDVGLTPGKPGCTPNLVIIATSDGKGLAQHLVETRRGALRLGGSGTDRGGAALRDFMETDRPVRWWQVSMPTDSDTGGRATRLPGDCRNDCMGDPQDFGPIIFAYPPSRLSTQIVDNIFRTIVIVDVDEARQLNATQLADYIAMVSLAQIDPRADTSSYATILNVFSAQQDEASLTEWDKAYLAGLYRARRNQRDTQAGVTEIRASIQRAHARLSQEDRLSVEPKD